MGTTRCPSGPTAGAARHRLPSGSASAAGTTLPGSELGPITRPSAPTACTASGSGRLASSGPMSAIDCRRPSSNAVPCGNAFNFDSSSVSATSATASVPCRSSTKFAARRAPRSDADSIS